MIIPEILPSETRGIAMTIAISVNWISNGFLSLMFLKLISWLTAAVVFWIFAGLSVLAFLFVVFLVPETKNKSVLQIWREWN